MSSKSTSSNLANLLKAQFQDPIRLRFILCALLLAVWYFAYHSPSTEYIQSTSGRTEKEKKRLATAQEVEKLRKSLEPFASRIPTKEGQNELIQYVMGHVRQTPLKLVDLSPGRNELVGTLRLIELELKLQGTYSDLDDFLNWVEHERRLLRVDSLKIQSERKMGQQKGLLAIEIDLLGLVDAPEAAAQKAATKDAAKAKKSAK